MFVVPFDTTKLNPSMRNESVTPNKEKKYLVMMKKHLRIQNNRVIRKKKQRINLWHQLLEKPS